MKKKFKKSLSVLLAAVVLAGIMCIAPMTVGAVTTSCTTYDGSNVNAQNYSTWSSPVESYLCSCSDGTLMRVQSGRNISGVLVEYYDKEYNLLSTKTISAELPIFGGFYESDSNYFIVTGQNNFSESADTEVFRITKYDKDWNRIASAGLKDCNTTVPFDAGSLRMAQCGKYLLIRTGHEMYTTSDGYNHQANVTIELDTESMKITDSCTSVLFYTYGYVSHSFNQFIKVENNRIVAVDHGDAYPRAIALINYNTDASTGKFLPTWNDGCDVTEILSFPGEIGNNTTKASVGGFEISDTAYLVAGNSVPHDDLYNSNTTRNIFVAAVSKDNKATTINWITDYGQGEESASTPQLVKINDNSYYLLWSRENKVYYTEIDGRGSKVGDIYSMEGSLSDCVPVVSNGKLIWYTWNYETNTFYDIDLSSPSTYNVTEIENGHDFINEGVTDGKAALKCTKCGYTTTVAVPASMQVWWQENGTGIGTFLSYFSGMLNIGDTLDYWVTYEPSDARGDFEVIVSDPSVLSVEEDSSTTGKLTMLKGGTATVTIRAKLNPEVSREYTVNVKPAADSGILGDIDNDGKVTVKDVLLYQKHLAKIMFLTDDQKTRADINGDSDYNTKDILLIQKIIAKIAI